MSLKDHEPLILKAAEAFRLDANLIRAIILTESAGDQWAVRYEPTNHYLNAPRDFASRHGLSLATEEMLQSTSFGLMQILGVRARDLGYMGNLMMLITPDLSTFYGCKNLKKLSERYSTEPEIISAYNAGSVLRTPGGMFRNQKEYVDRVYDQLLKLRKLN